MRRLLVTVAATAVVFGLSSATASAKPKWWDHKPAGSIVDVAVKASSANGPDANPYDYDLLIAAVTATGLAPTLDDEGQTFTGFAPNDRAFQRLVRDLTGTDRLPPEAEALAAVLATFSADQIKNILLYHVVAGEALRPLEVIFAGLQGQTAKGNQSSSSCPGYIERGLPASHARTNAASNAAARCGSPK